MQVCWLLHSFLFSIIIDWITQCAFSNWLCFFLNGVKSRWCLCSQSMSNKSARAHTIHSHGSGLSREFNQVTIDSIIQFVYHRHMLATLCVCVCVPVRELMCSLESSLPIPSSVMWLIGTLRLRLSSSDGWNKQWNGFRAETKLWEPQHKNTTTDEC